MKRSTYIADMVDDYTGEILESFTYHDEFLNKRIVNDTIKNMISYTDNHFPVRYITSTISRCDDVNNEIPEIVCTIRCVISSVKACVMINGMATRLMTVR